MLEQAKARGTAKIQGGGGPTGGKLEGTTIDGTIEAIDAALAAEDEQRQSEDRALFEALNPKQETRARRGGCCGCFC